MSRVTQVSVYFVNVVAIVARDQSTRVSRHPIPFEEEELNKLPPSSGKPYKTLDAKPIPLDCAQEQAALGNVFSLSNQLTTHIRPMCQIPGIY
jgi:hypothetical protein